MQSFLVLVQESQERELPVPPVWIGVGAFIGLLVLLMVTLAIGKGRPHS